MFLRGWCLGACSKCVIAPDAVEGIENVVDYCEIDTSDRETLLSWGIADGIYVEGEPYGPYEQPCTRDVFRRDLLWIAEGKGKT